MANSAIATVVAVVGTAFARNEDGEMREIRPGDVILEGETVVTPDGSYVELSMSDGSPFVVSGVEEMTLTRDLVAERASGADESAVEDESIDALLAALEGDGDIGDVLEATAAGAGGAGGAEGGGHSFIRLGRISEGVDEFAGLAAPSSPAAEGPAEQDPDLLPVDAIDDVETTEPNTPVIIDVQENDIFVEGGTVTSVTQPQNGTVVINSDNTVTYTPNDGFFGEDTFTYTAISANGEASDTANVTVTIPEPPPPPPPPPVLTLSIDDVTVVEGNIGELTVTLSGPSDQPVTVAFASQDDTATVIGGDYNPDTGEITFAPGQTSATIQFQTNEDNLQEGTEQFLVNLSNPNGAEIADGQGVVTIVDDFTPSISINDVTVTEGQVATLTLSLSAAVGEAVTVQFASADDTATVVGGDYDPGTGTITFPAGTTEVTVSFQTNTDNLEELTEQFLVNLSNPTNAVIADDQGIVEIVDATEPPPPPPPPPPGNNPPDAVNDAFTTEVNTPVSGNVLPNDSDPDSDPLTVIANTQPGNGSVVVNPDGSFTYTPNNGFDGSDTFTYTITDGEGGTDTATVTITIDDNPVDLNVPVAGDDGTLVSELGLPARDGEPAGSAGDDSETTSGQITFSGSDAPLTISINGSPVSVNDSVAGENGFGTLTVTAIDLVAGTLDYSYTLEDNTNGDDTVDTFTVSVSDVDGDTESGTLTIEITDDAPTALDDSNSIAEGAFGPVSGNVVTENDTVGADDASVTGVTGTPVAEYAGAFDFAIQGDYGVLELSADGSYQYTRDAGTPGGVSDAFTYTLTDGDGDADTAVLTIDIGNGDVQVNVPQIGGETTTVFEEALAARPGEPQGSNEPATTESTSGTVNFTATDQPITLTVDGVEKTAGQTVVTQKGVLTIDSINAATGEIGYTYELTDNTLADPDQDDFVFRVTDVDGDFDEDTLSIAIIDDAPTALDDSNSVAAGAFGPVSGNVVTENDTVGADDASVTGVTGTPVAEYAGAFDFAIQGDYGVLELSADGSYQYTRDAGAPGGVSDAFTYTLTDGDGDADTAVLTIDIGNGDVQVNVPQIGGETTTVFEEALAARPGEPQGSNEPATTESTSGTVNFTATDQPITLTVDGVEKTAGQTVVTQKGVLTIDSINAATGEIGYTYELTDNTLADPDQDDFVFRVTDVDGDFDEDTLSIAIIDDAPTALDDSNSVAAGAFGPVSGNVVTENDTVGADDASVTGVTGTPVAEYAGAFDFAIQGDYGVLELSADGSYQYTRDAGTPGGVSDAFTYTLTDGDGDADTAVLTIDIGNGDVQVNVPQIGGETTTVFEEALAARPGEPQGSNEPATTESTSGTVNFTATDQPITLTVDGVEKTAGQTVVTQKGVLTIDSINAATGEIGYTYELTDNTLADPDQDDFVFRVTDVDGDFDEDTLSIAIIDDAPTALDDSNSVAAGAFGPVSGNVVTENDTVGADDASVTGVTGTPVAEYAGAFDFAIQGDYGVLELSADGSYQYTRDAGAPGGVSDAFTYTLTDGDGDADTAVLTIDIGDGDVEVFVPAAGGDTTTVSELGLPGRDVGDGAEPEGTGEAANPAAETDDSETVAGSFTYSAADVPVDITVAGSLVVDGGVLVTAGDANVITTDRGVLTITGINTGTQTVSYSYTLTDNVDHSGGAVTDDFAVVVSDADGDSDSDTLSIAIENDAPVANDIVTGVDEDSSVTFAADFVPGADAGVITAINGEALVFTDDVSQAVETGDDATHDGTVVYDRSTNQFTYTPVAQFPEAGDAQDAFTYTVTDSDGDTDDGTATVDVNAIADMPFNELTVDTAVERQTNNVNLDIGDGQFGVGGIQGDDVINGTPGEDYSETFDVPLSFGQTFANQVITVDITANVSGSWNYDGSGPFFDDNWGIGINGQTVAQFFYNANINAPLDVTIPSNGQLNVYNFANPSSVNNNFSINGQQIMLDVELDENGEALITFGAATTQQSEFVELTAAATANLPDTLIYTLDLSAALGDDDFDGSESLSIRIEGVPDDAVLEAPPGSPLTVTLLSDDPGGTSTYSIESTAESIQNDSLLLQINQTGTPGNYTDPQFTLDLFSVATEASNGDSAEFGPFRVTVDGESVTNVGLVIDGVVEGMNYVTSSGLSGVTDESGTFRYASGDTVTFSVGSAVLGSFVADEVMSDGKVFLQEIAGVGLENLNDEYVENMAVFLQSLDSDGDAYNGIVINDGIHDAFSAEDFDLATMSETELASVLTANGYTPVTEDDAMQHVKDMIVEHAGHTEFDERVSDATPLLATEGDDVFAFALDGEGEAPADVSIAGFGESGEDSLDLRDLLQGEEAEDANLTDYLNVTYDGADTVIQVSAEGSFRGDPSAAAVDQTITLEGVDLVTGHDDMASVIQNMLDSGKLSIDQ